MNINHDENREKELQTLCKGILNVGVNFWEESCGPYHWVCPLCGEEITGGWFYSEPTMEDIKHDLDCPWLIAKDLSNGVDNDNKENR